jgi:SAM-dependent methyltransferase
MSNQLRFDDGAAYERMMGTWSRIVGEEFLRWVAPPDGLHWVDVGCGNGAFTELLMQSCAPSSVEGIDPSPAQIAYAEKRPGAAGAHFSSGDAMALPFEDASFDAAAAALVLFFVPDPARGLAEMVRVTRPGGLVCAYLWDIPGGGLPHEPIRLALQQDGIDPPLPPSAPISTMGALRDLFAASGLQRIETRVFEPTRRFADFDEWWETSLLGSSLAAVVESLGPERVAPVRERLRAQLGAQASQPLVRSARANAIKAVKPT